MSNTTTTTTPAPSLSDRDIVVIAATVGAVAGLVALVIIVLLLCQKFYRKTPHPEDERHIISRFPSTQNSFLSQDYSRQQNHVYDNNNANSMEFRERPQLAPQRSRSFQERREYVEPEYRPESKGYYDTRIQRSGSLDFTQMRMWDNKFPDSRHPQSKEPIRRIPDNVGPEYHVATLPSGNRMPTYHVPRPAVGGRFEPLWKGSLYM